ncbi:flavodoxin family protein [Alteromonas sp. ASW11-130]|uniref:flavodoxin family protein n=1 Tax=Alteromonas sp. ASW11-130 TaxID=3015775 RepID=UPI0022429BA9|nr:NAD(P)H-dependent oxidoreductase [Alteromonas sp. ASW11-130]MCW8092025.1 NAD(P)H-dependent oxidoreductase [Alteromonas sp. ASW11-130]
MKTAIILGSSRSNGNTNAFARQVEKRIGADFFDLADYQIAPFDYHNSYEDDFAGLIAQLLRYKQLIFASPVYWYAASAQMKVFLDRLTDLLNFHKDEGRQLRGKRVGLLATGIKPIAPNCFEQMFKLTFEYLGMEYKGMGYCCTRDTFELTTHGATVNGFVDSIGY